MACTFFLADCNTCTQALRLIRRMPMEIATNLAKLRVRHFRQILLWPLQLMPLPDDGPLQSHSQLLEQVSADNPWRELADEFCGDPEQFHERHYSEFVTFLPYVQRFLYGEKGGQEASPHATANRRSASSAATTWRRCA
jgi:hypothetical protein